MPAPGRRQTVAAQLGVVGAVREKPVSAQIAISGSSAALSTRGQPRPAQRAAPEPSAGTGPTAGIGGCMAACAPRLLYRRPSRQGAGTTAACRPCGWPRTPARSPGRPPPSSAGARSGTSAGGGGRSARPPGCVFVSVTQKRLRGAVERDAVRRAAQVGAAVDAQRVECAPRAGTAAAGVDHEEALAARRRCAWARRPRRPCPRLQRACRRSLERALADAHHRHLAPIRRSGHPAGLDAAQAARRSSPPASTTDTVSPRSLPTNSLPRARAASWGRRPTRVCACARRAATPRRAGRPLGGHQHRPARGGELGGAAPRPAGRGAPRGRCPRRPAPAGRGWSARRPAARSPGRRRGPRACGRPAPRGRRPGRGGGDFDGSAAGGEAVARAAARGEAAPGERQRGEGQVVPGPTP